VAPTLVAIAALVGVGLYGLSQSHGAATLNNVAFASLHAVVLLTAAIPALRLRPSAPLLPDPPELVRPTPPRAWPKPLAATVLAAAVLVPTALGLLGAKGLASHPTLSQQAHSAADAFFSRYVKPDGRVARTDQGGDTVSEGQAYAMLLAVALDDKPRFDRVWGWTRENLQRSDGLLAYHWENGHVDSTESATDADLDAARALVLAGKRFGSEDYKTAGVRVGEAVLRIETSEVSGLPVIVAGPWARSGTPVVNPSYFSPRAYADLASARADARWDDVAGTSRAIETALTDAGQKLPPDWSRVDAITASGGGEASADASALASPGIPGPYSTSSSGPVSSFDALRLAIRSAESCVPADRRIAASLWPLYRRHPGKAMYALDGTPVGGQSHAASYVAAAAAAKAAGDREAVQQLLDQAQQWDSEHPTYYGSAWVALGRVMLTSAALGSCPG
jgi:endoglucanase